MTSGALIFAYNNDKTDYVKMAAWTANNIKRHLRIPVALVTNSTDINSNYNFDKIIHLESNGSNGRYFSDYNSNVIWHNTTRTDAYSVTPWDQTLVIDADYVVASNALNVVLQSSQEFLAHNCAYDITGLNDFSGLNYFGNYHMPMWWATLMMFRKSKQAELLFDTMKMVRDNWKHYQRIYHNNQPTYRNDHALTISLGMVNGHHSVYPNIPWQLASLTTEHKLTQIDIDRYRVDFITPDRKLRWINIDNQDFHAMGKQQLGEIIDSQI